MNNIIVIPKAKKTTAGHTFIKRVEMPRQSDFKQE